jgi:large subunit ribosomal protein L14e
MITIGRVCTKLAGRDAGKTCVVVETYDKGLVLIDGETRRRTCNIRHLFPRQETLDIKKGATHEDVLMLLAKAGLITIRESKKKDTPKPIKEQATKPDKPKAKQKAPKKKAK